VLSFYIKEPEDRADKMNPGHAMIRSIIFFPLQESNGDLQEMCFLKPPSRKNEKILMECNVGKKFTQSI
jgi:hypothetical protein